MSAALNTTAPRWLHLPCDPTLRLNTVGAPNLTGANVSGGNVLLTWTAGEGGASATHYIYRSANSTGPFTLWGSATGGQTGFPISDDNTKRWYMVRTAKSISSGRVPYTSLSQGSIKKAL